MTTSPHGTTPSQAPVMSLEKWDARLKEIAARINDATPGPWKACKAKEAFENWPVCPSLGEDFDGVEWGVSTDGIHASEMDRGDAGKDAQFIGHARQDLPDLLAYARSLQAELEALRAENKIACHALRRIESRAEGDDADPWWIASSTMFTIEKARQPNV